MATSTAKLTHSILLTLSFCSCFIQNAAQIKRLEAEIEFQSRSEVVKREGAAAVPRIVGAVNDSANISAAAEGDDENGQIQMQIQQEMLHIMQHDQFKHPR